MKSTNHKDPFRFRQYSAYNGHIAFQNKFAVVRAQFKSADR